MCINVEEEDEEDEDEQDEYEEQDEQCDEWLQRVLGVICVRSGKMTGASYLCNAIMLIMTLH